MNYRKKVKSFFPLIVGGVCSVLIIVIIGVKLGHLSSDQFQKYSQGTKALSQRLGHDFSDISKEGYSLIEEKTNTIIAKLLESKGREISKEISSLLKKVELDLLYLSQRPPHLNLIKSILKKSEIGNNEKKPYYLEVNYFDLTGNEIYKTSRLNSKLVNVKNQKNTYNEFRIC